MVVDIHNEHDGGGDEDDDDDGGDGEDDDGGVGPDVGGFVCVKQCPAGRVIYLCKGPESKGLSSQGQQLIMHSCSWCPQAALLRYSCSWCPSCDTPAYTYTYTYTYTYIYIWVIFPRTGKMSKICPFFLFFEASL